MSTTTAHRFASHPSGSAPSNPILLAFRDYVVDPYDSGLDWAAGVWLDAMAGILARAPEAHRMYSRVMASPLHETHAQRVLERLARVNQMREPLHFHSEVSDSDRQALNRAYRHYEAYAAAQPDGVPHPVAAVIDTLMRYARISER